MNSELRHNPEITIQPVNSWDAEASGGASEVVLSVAG